MVYFGLSTHSHFLELRNVTPRKHLPPLLFSFSPTKEKRWDNKQFSGAKLNVGGEGFFRPGRGEEGNDKSFKREEGRK